MTQDAERSFAGTRLEDADFSRARLHAPNFQGTRITDAWLREADFSGDIHGMRVNGIEIAPLVEAELDRQFPERRALRATDPKGLAGAWAMIEDLWASTLEQARRLDEPLLHERVDGEWSFVETLRHLILATDCWLNVMILGKPRPYHRFGLAGSFLTEPERIGLEPAADPTLDEVLAVRRGRMDAVALTLSSLTPDELGRPLAGPSDGSPPQPDDPATVLSCLGVILNEEWEHCRYAARDLGILESRGP